MKDSINSIFDIRSELRMLRFHTSMFLTTPFFLISVLGSCFSFSLFKIFSMIQGLIIIHFGFIHLLQLYGLLLFFQQVLLDISVIRELWTIYL